MAERTNAELGLIDSWTAELGGPQTKCVARPSGQSCGLEHVVCPPNPDPQQ